MAINLSNLKRKNEVKPPRIVTYGVHGVGKTTWATTAPSPVAFCIEDGLGTLDVPHFELYKQGTTFGDVMDGLGSLYTERHEFQSLIVDSLDWLEPLVWAETCRRNKWADIEAAGFGKGYLATLDVWREYLDGINALRNDRNMAIIQIAHSNVKRFDSPETEPYDRYEIKLHKGAAALVMEHCDCLFFANYKVSVVKSDAGFNKKVARGVGRGARALYTSEKPAYLAKNRYGLPDELDMDLGFDALTAAMFAQPTA
jgi:hypothetical protein